MNIERSRLDELWMKYLDGTSTPEEQWELMLGITLSENEILFKEKIVAGLEAAQSNEMIAADFLSVNEDEEVFQSIISTKVPARVIPIYRRKIFKYIAAASIFVITSLLVILSLSKNENGGKPTTAQTHDVPAPTNARAVITLADGSKVYLDSTGNGILAQQNNVNVVKNDKGEIIYSPDHQITPSPIAYNTLFNPRGSKVISLTLSDGTKVWLNSESSLKYPIAFNDKTREVEITGEAYFEVAHNSKQPFKVHLPNGSIVEDIGTSFNINAYSDEQNIKTTLVEGAVKVSQSSRPGALAVKLKPGQQAVLNTFNLQLLTFNNVDLEATLAWKNGLFSFTDAGIETVMKQVARWYDVEVVYQDKPTKIFRGSIPREMSAANVFKALEETGGVHFKIEGRKVIVLR